MSVPLSKATTERVESLFQGDDAVMVCRRLADECGDNLPFCEKATPETSERVRYAVLKISSGNVEKFERALALAKQDWRDVLVAAGFANDVTAHARWWPGRSN